MIQKIKDWINLIWERLLNLDEMAVITLVTTVTFVVIVGFMMRALVGMEDQHIPKSPPQQRRHQHRHRPTEPPTRPTLYVHPLCVDNFDSVVMDVDPGVRTIVLLVDEATQHKLLLQFAAVVEPYTRSDAFVCGFLQLEQYLPWYRHLLEETLDFKRDLTKINSKNCIGTVLALNGPRKYYCMYSAQRERQQMMAQAAEKGGEFLGLDDSDAESTEAEELARQKLFESDLLASLGMWMERLCEGTLQRQQMMAQAAEKGGEFLGLDDSDAESTEAEELARQKLFESDLLASLGMWMERLCEGTLQRYRVDYWPRMES